MRFAEVLPEDAPDPRVEQTDQVRLMPIPVVGLAPQPSLQETNAGVGGGQDGSGYFEVSTSLSYTLWRNPSDRSDPLNLAELDEQTRAAIEEVPPWPRPQWLIEQVEQMRYPQLAEAVKTTWFRESNEHTALTVVLAQHANYILTNWYRPQRGLDGNPWDAPAPDVTQRAVRHGITVRIDGSDVIGAEIDTDPFVYCVGAELPTGGILTAVLPRDDLAYIRLEFTTRH